MRLTALLLGTIAGPALAAAVNVTAEPFGKLATHLHGSAPAAVVSLNDSRIGAEIGAMVASIPVRVGDRVEAGAPLVQLECGDHQRALSRAEAQRAALQARARLAKEQLERAQALRGSNSVSEELLNQREAEATALRADLRGAEAQLDQAKADVNRCTVAAPFPALVTERLVSVGEQAERGRALVRVVDLEQVELSVQLQALESRALNGAGELWFEAEGQRRPVQLRAITPVRDPRSRTHEARFLFSGEPPEPGTVGRLVWRDQQPHVPAELVVRRGDKYGVFTVQQQKARFHALPDAQEGRPAVCDLAADVPVVVRGRYALQDGDAVILD